MPGYQVDPQVLRDGSNDIADAISPADGMQLENISENGAAFGDDAVSSALSDFCSTWELATGILQQRSASAGETLNGAAASYAEQEERTANSMPRQGGH